MQVKLSFSAIARPEKCRECQRVERDIFHAPPYMAVKLAPSCLLTVVMAKIKQQSTSFKSVFVSKLLRPEQSFKEKMRDSKTLEQDDRVVKWRHVSCPFKSWVDSGTAAKFCAPAVGFEVLLQQCHLCKDVKRLGGYEGKANILGTLKNVFAALHQATQ